MEDNLHLSGNQSFLLLSLVLYLRFGTKIDEFPVQELAQDSYPEREQKMIYWQNWCTKIFEMYSNHQQRQYLLQNIRLKSSFIILGTERISSICA